MIEPDKKGGPGKWLLGIAVIIIIALAAALVLKPSSAPQPIAPQAPVVQPKKKAAKPTSASVNYGTTFAYGKNSVTVNRLKASSLGKKQAKLKYSLTVRGNSAWVQKSRFVLVDLSGKSSQPQQLTLGVKSGEVQNFSLVYSWPKKLLDCGSGLQLSVPGQGSAGPVILGLQIKAVSKKRSCIRVS